MIIIKQLEKKCYCIEHFHTIYLNGTFKNSVSSVSVFFFSKFPVKLQFRDFIKISTLLTFELNVLLSPESLIADSTNLYAANLLCVNIYNVSQLRYHIRCYFHYRRYYSELKLHFLKTYSTTSYVQEKLSRVN